VKHDSNFSKSTIISNWEWLPAVSLAFSKTQAISSRASSTSVFYLDNVSAIFQLGLYFNLGSFFKASKEVK
jgi:hypothetical protein